MFKRWVILLLVLLAACAASIYYHSGQSEASWALFYECGDYLDTLNNDWDFENDTWYYQRCDLDNPVSDVSLDLQWGQIMDRAVYFSIRSFYYILIILFLSFIGRWLVTGRLKWD